MRFFVNSSVDPAFNLALEECLSRTPEREEFLMLWRNHPAVILGRNQNAEAEVNLARAAALRIPVVRRMSGGGAVYHDFGGINYTSIQLPGIRRRGIGEAILPMAEVLRSFGIEVIFSGRNDLLCGGRKISGSAMSVLHDRNLFHGSLLFDTDMEMLERLLKPDLEKLALHGVRSVRSRVANLREFLPQWEREAFFGELTRRLLVYFGLERVSEIPPRIAEEAEALARKKYRTRNWNVDAAPCIGFSRRKRFACGTVAVAFEVRGGRLEKVRFSGDFLGDAPASELAARLCGASRTEQELATRFAEADCGRFFPGCTPEELCGLFL